MRACLPLTVLLVLTGCAAAPTGPRAAPSATTSPERVAQERADALVRGVVLPEGARETDAPASPRLAQPATTVETVYQVGATRYWTLPLPFVEAVEDLKTRDEAGQTVSGSGSGSDRTGPTSAFVQYGDLQIALAPLDATTTAVRADALVLWRPERPAGEHVPGPVLSATVTAYDGLPERVTGSAVVTGARAQHLGDLVEALVRDNRGSHSCPLDSGRRRRVELTAERGTAVVDGFSCGSTSMTVDGQAQPTLADSQELDDAVEEALRNGS